MFFWKKLEARKTSFTGKWMERGCSVERSRSLVRNAATKMVDLINKWAELLNPLVNQATFDWSVWILHAVPSEDDHYPSVFKGCKRVKT